MRALLLDFNGTISDDEPILCRIFQELFAEAGKPLSEEEYFEQLAGLSDAEIIRDVARAGRPGAARAEDRAVSRAAATARAISEEARAAVRDGAERVRLAVVSGSSREEIEPVLEAAGIRECFEAIVSVEDVRRGKPDPEGYLRATRAPRRGVRHDAAAVEDSAAGVAAAKAAGLYCVAVTTSFDARLASRRPTSSRSGLIET